MNFAQLFSFEGRQRRLHFWLVAIAITIVNGIVSSFTYGPAYTAMLTGAGSAAAVFSGLGLVGCIVSLILFWPALANSVKRCHDRNKSGWWVVLMWLASLTIVGALWPLIELGFLDGTQGPNKFGPSPKGIGAPAAAAA